MGRLILLLLILSLFDSRRVYAFKRHGLHRQLSSQSKPSSSSAKFASTKSEMFFLSAFLLPFAFSSTVVAIDPAELRQFAKPGQVVQLGGKGNLEDKLKQYQETQNVLDIADVEFTELPSGVKFRSYREGKGERVVKPGSIVTVQMSVRCESLVTNADPGGVKYFTTAKDTVENSLTWQIGSGKFLPGLEEGMMGMKRNSIRRVEVPSIMVFAARDADQLPLPAKSGYISIFS